MAKDKRPDERAWQGRGGVGFRGRSVIDPQAIWLVLVALLAFESYLALPPGIPFITSYGLIPLRLRLTNYAMIGLVAYGLYAFGFTLLESLALGCFWITLGVYLVFDSLYDMPLTI